MAEEKETKKLRKLLAAQIKINLARIGKTAPQFAKEKGISPSTLYRFINCENAASLDVIELIAKGFGVPAFVLLSPVVE